MVLYISLSKTCTVFPSSRYLEITVSPIFVDIVIVIPFSTDDVLATAVSRGFLVVSWSFSSRLDDIFGVVGNGW